MARVEARSEVPRNQRLLDRILGECYAPTLLGHRVVGGSGELIGILGQWYPVGARWDFVVPFGNHRHYGRVAERDTSQTDQPDS